MFERMLSNDLEKSFSDIGLGFQKSEFKKLADLLTKKLNQKLKSVQIQINEALERLFSQTLSVSSCKQLVIE